MGIIVKKFGGSSVSSIERIKAVAQRIVENENENEIVVVVSAMGNATDELNKLASQISKKPSKRELDMLLTAGERVSMSLLSIALQDLGYNSISFTGSQSGVLTDGNHGNARIQHVTAFRIREELKKNKIVIVAGFQGVSPEKEITTLGRGGSDTTAVALACYLNAEKCEIYTDVDAVKTADPRAVKNAKSIQKISHNLMLSLAKSGAVVIHSRAIEFAMKYDKDIELKSSFNKNGGTLITKDISEQTDIKAITSKENLLYLKISCTVEFSFSILKEIEKKGIDLFYKALEQDNLTLVFSQPEENEINLLLMDIEFEELCREKINAFSIVGVKVNQNFEFSSRLTDFLLEKKIDIFGCVFEDLKLTFYSKNTIVDIKKRIEEIHNMFIV